MIIIGERPGETHEYDVSEVMRLVRESFYGQGKKTKLVYRPGFDSLFVRGECAAFAMTSADGYTFYSSRLRTLLCCVGPVIVYTFEIFHIGIFYIKRVEQ